VALIAEGIGISNEYQNTCARRTAFGEQALNADIRSSAARRSAFDPRRRFFAAAAAAHDLGWPVYGMKISGHLRFLRKQVKHW